MPSVTSKDWRDWPTPPVLEDTVYDSHSPLSVLRGLKKAQAIGDVWFHTDELESAGRAWMEAAKSTVRDSIEWRAFVDEAKKFAVYWRQIIDEERDSGIPQAMMVEAKDWPPVTLFDQAIAAIQRAMN